MRTFCLSLLLVSLALSPLACGDPEVKLPDPLEVVYLPLDGAIDVELDVAVQLYFSGEVDDTSVTGSSVMLEQADYDDQEETCGDWSDSGLVPAVLADDPRVIRLGTDADQLSATTCYRITCTTDVQGVELGPLPDLGLTGRKGVAVDATFRTRD
jgi:hypothetical protein